MHVSQCQKLFIINLKHVAGARCQQQVGERANGRSAKSYATISVRRAEKLFLHERNAKGKQKKKTEINDTSRRRAHATRKPITRVTRKLANTHAAWDAARGEGRVVRWHAVGKVKLELIGTAPGQIRVIIRLPKYQQTYQQEQKQKQLQLPDHQLRLKQRSVSGRCSTLKKKEENIY